MNRASTVGVLVLGAAAGLLLSLYGPALPELRATYGVGGGGSALVLSAHFFGATTGIGWWGLERRLSARTWLRLATTLLVAGAVAMTLAPAWPVVLGAAFAIGVGFGVVVVEINVLFTDAFGDRAAAMLNLLGACFGAGAVLGPLALAASGGYRVPFCGGALLAVVAVGLTRDLPATATPPARDPGPPLGLVGGFVALLLLYVGVENGVGGFEATSLRAGGTAAGAAASWTAGYWAAITTGGRPVRLHPDRPGPWAGVPDRAGLAGRGGGGAGADGPGVRGRQPRRGGAAGGDRPAGGRQLAGGDPDHRAAGGAGLPERNRAARALGRPRPVTSAAAAQPERRSPTMAR